MPAAWASGTVSADAMPQRWMHVEQSFTSAPLRARSCSIAARSNSGWPPSGGLAVSTPALMRKSRTAMPASTAFPARRNAFQAASVPLYGGLLSTRSKVKRSAYLLTELRCSSSEPSASICSKRTSRRVSKALSIFGLAMR